MFGIVTPRVNAINATVTNSSNNHHPQPLRPPTTMPSTRSGDSTMRSGLSRQAPQPPVSTGGTHKRATSSVDDSAQQAKKPKIGPPTKKTKTQKQRYVPYTFEIMFVNQLELLGKPRARGCRRMLKHPNLRSLPSTSMLFFGSFCLIGSYYTVTIHRSEKILNESGISVAPPEHARSATASLIPPAPTLAPSGRQLRSEVLNTKDQQEIGRAHV